MVEVQTAFGRVESRPPTLGRLQFCDAVRLVVVTQNEYGDIMKERVQQLRSDGMCLFFDILEDLESPFPSRDDSSSDLMQTIQDINKAMSNLSRPHVLYRGKVYTKTRWCQVYIYRNDEQGNIPTQIDGQSFHSRGYTAKSRKIE